MVDIIGTEDRSRKFLMSVVLVADSGYSKRMVEQGNGDVSKVQSYWWRTESREVAADASPVAPGDHCPECAEGVLEYDSLFILTCPRCGYVAESGVCT